MMLAGHVRDAKIIADSLLVLHDDCIGCVTISGEAAAILGNKAEAQKAVDRLLAFNQPHMQGGNIYAAARIKARMGEKAEAVQLLRESISKGVYYGSFNDAEPAFFSLRGYAPFEQLLKPAD